MGAIVYKYTKAPPPSRSPSPKQKPLPRAAYAAFPSPSCSGKRPKVERWRGVNGLANYELITTLQTIVGRWSPCHVLQHPIYVIIMEDGYHYGDRYLMEDGARRPSSYLVCFAWCFFALRWLLVGLRCLLLGFVPSLVGRWPPCHVLQQAK